MEEGELFDSNMLKDTINGEIGKGNRNFALDFSGLEYIYSDTINVLLSLNKRILDVSGRLSILTPGNEALQILKRTGLHNILKIYETEDELLKSSEEIILQTSSFKLSDIKQYNEQPAAPAQPKSEFEDMRAEFGTSLDAPAFGGKQQPAPRHYQQEPAFEAPRQPAAPQFPPRRAEAAPSFEPSFEQPAPQPFQIQPVQDDSFSQFQEPRQSEAQAAPSFTPPPASRPQPRFEQPEAAPVPAKKSTALRDFERDTGSSESFENDLFDKPKKSNAMAIVLAVVLGLLVLAGGAVAVKFFVLDKQNESETTEAVPPVQPAPSIPQVAETPAPSAAVPVPAPAPEPAAAPAPAPEPVKTSKPERPAPPPAFGKKPAPAPVAAKPAYVPPPPPAPVSSRPAPGAVPAVQEGKNALAITSSPSGAFIVVDGRTLGTTPYTWDNPFFGDINIKLTKPGFKDNLRTVEFTGGTKSENFIMENEPVAPPPPPPPAPAPRPEPAPVAATPPPPPPPAPTPAPTPAPAPAAASGEPASIFISSLPPVADVFMDGQLIGKTNLSELKVRAGTHSMKFVKNGTEVVKEMTFQPGKNPSQVIRVQ